MLLEIIPVAVSVRTGSMIVDKIVIWISNPDASWSLIGVEETPRPLGHHDQVSGDIVVSFNAVFDEYVVTHGIEDNVIRDSQILISVNSKGSIERGVNSVSYCL